MARKKDKLTFEPGEVSSELKVHYGDEYLGTIRKYQWKPEDPEKWRWYHVGAHRYDFSVNKPEDTELPAFPSKELAGEALYAFKKTIDANPLTSEMRHYFEEEARRHNDRKKQILSELFTLERHRAWLSMFAKKYQFNIEFDGDPKKEVTDLLKFMDEHNDAMYEQLGKDFARSLRAYVASVVRIVDPDAAKDI